MKRAFSLFSVMGVAVAIISAGLLQSGCEEAKGLQGLQVDPRSATLTSNDQTTVFAVTGGITNETLALPLTWTVQDEGLGRITHSSGFTAIYQRSDPDGVNTVIVRDQYDNEGYATVQQSTPSPTNPPPGSYSLKLTATKTSISTGEGVTITVATEAAQAPFRWRLVSGPGTVSDSSGGSAAYSSTTAGTAVIEAKDANDATGVIAITVTVSSDGGSGGGGGPGGS